MLSDIDVIVCSSDWNEKLASIEAVEDKYFRYIQENNLLPMINLLNPEISEELVWAERLEAWSNPNWRDWLTRCKKEAVECGQDICDFWVFSLWGKV